MKVPFSDFIQNLSLAPSKCLSKWKKWIKGIISISTFPNQVWTKITIRSYAWSYVGLESDLSSVNKKLVNELNRTWTIFYASYFFRSIFTCLIIEKLMVEERADNVFLEGKLEHMAKDMNMECSKDSNESCLLLFWVLFSWSKQKQNKGSVYSSICNKALEEIGTIL